MQDGHSHAIYNPTDKPVQWMNINVSAMKDSYDAFDLGDSRADVQLDPNPVFMTMRLDRALLRPLTSPAGGNGTAQYGVRSIRVFLRGHGLMSIIWCCRLERLLLRICIGRLPNSTM
jgi:hypothetical protein